MSSPIQIPNKQLRKPSVPPSPTYIYIQKIKRPDLDINGEKIKLQDFIKKYNTI
jgi:hypothetical protein